MSGLRGHFRMGLVLLMCTLTGHCSESAPSAMPPASTAASKDKQQDLRRIVEIVKHVEENRGGHAGKVEAALTTTVTRSSLVEPKDLHSLKTDRGDQVVVVYPRDLRKKERLLKHITGPLYFSPKCRKHVYRLYHHTRDCTIPAFYRRCARLLTRLAGSPQCTEG
ncbi:ALK and LTK ligand 2-like [Notolabrus celidotus]|uniref:ALK and LTK ligand 2-like n=1 Tax=Notolabrus celidotus TaxID=1203425 RepID=UPI00148FF0CD|nr:ALK and LTK ligand 2-like [Notolabrus celidotus]